MDLSKIEAITMKSLLKIYHVKDFLLSSHETKTLHYYPNITQNIIPRIWDFCWDWDLGNEFIYGLTSIYFYNN